MKKGCLIAILIPVVLIGGLFVLFIALGNRTNNQPRVFTPPQENRTVQTKDDKFSGQKVYIVGPLLVSFDEKIDEPLLMTFNMHYTEGSKKPFRTVILFSAKTVDIGERKYQRGDIVYALAAGERLISEPLQMLKDETAYWGSVDRLQGFTVDTTPQVFEKLANAKHVEFRVGATEFEFKPEHQEALRAMLAAARKG